MNSYRLARFGGFVAIGAVLGCASMGNHVDVPKLPMGIGQVLIDAVTNDPDEESGLRISPDGRFLLFNNLSSARSRGGPGFLDGLRQQGSADRRIASAYEQNSVSLIELGKPGKTIVSQEGAKDAAWFPDGKTFVFSMLQGKQAMLATSSVGQGTAAVKFVAPTPCVAYDASPSVSPNGQSLLFSTATASEAAVVATMDIKSSESKCKIMFPGRAPQWAPTGTKFVFVRVVGGRDQIFTFDQIRNQLTQVTFGNFDNSEPAWSPDGKSLVFVSNRSGGANIYSIAEDGSNLVQITQGPTDDHHPTWARDGSIYFVSRAGGQSDVWRARVQSR